MGINATYRALADPTRREILRILRQGDLTAGEIAEHFDLSRSTLSGHCNVLKAAGLIVSERNRSTVVYSINTSAFDEAAAAVISLFRSAEHRTEPETSAAGNGAPRSTTRSEREE